MNLRDVLKDYFDTESEKLPLNESLGFFSTVPVTPQKKDDWEVVSNPNRLNKTYEFQDQKTLQHFLNEILNYQNSINHHGKFIVDYLKVTAEVYTHDLDDVTEVDLEWAKTADDIYEDVKYYEPEYTRR